MTHPQAKEEVGGKRVDSAGNDVCYKCSADGRRLAVRERRIPPSVEHTCHPGYLGCDCKMWYEKGDIHQSSRQKAGVK